MRAFVAILVVLAAWEASASPLQLLSAKTVKCLDGTECSDDDTCCQLSSGKYGCCPYSQGVCCSDHLHCCPSGYTCNVTEKTCTKKSGSPAWVSKRPSVAISSVKNIVCPDGQSECPDGDTCCKLSSGQWGCCPLPNAVCCSDGQHCCPNGYTCDVKAGTCTKQSEIMSWVSKRPSISSVKNVICPDGQSECPDGDTCCKLSSGQWGCCPLPNAVCCSDGQHCCPNGYTCDVTSATCTKQNEIMSWVSKRPSISSVKNVICPDGQSECPDGDTCCKLSSGQWGCCPLPNAVCCSDGQHCCPNGYTCDVKAGTCTKQSEIMSWVSKRPSISSVKNVICPDGQSECPDGDTCCKLSSGQWGCCPLPNAVCCSDGQHCCPNGYTCDVQAATCTKQNEIMSWVSNGPSISSVKNIVCPDGQSECPDGDTCCKLSSGQWGCCPLPNAVCCSDGQHCCPNGYTCDVTSATCTKQNEIMSWVSKRPSISSVKNVICPDGQSECPDGDTCCKLSSGQWGCCPLPNAVCCSDGQHCCPNGYTCDVQAGTCTKQNEIMSWVSKPPSISSVKNVICPDGLSECPDGDTCCKLSFWQWACCPLPNAVCCSDGQHCCPNGYTCYAGTCTKQNEIMSWVSKRPSISSVKNVICPDGQSECPDGDTCCKLSSGQWGCCPLPNAVCCSDGQHCCPNGYTCDVQAETCTKQNEIMSWVSKRPSFWSDRWV